LVKVPASSDRGTQIRPPAEPLCDQQRNTWTMPLSIIMRRIWHECESFAWLLIAHWSAKAIQNESERILSAEKGQCQLGDISRTNAHDPHMEDLNATHSDSIDRRVNQGIEDDNSCCMKSKGRVWFNRSAATSQSIIWHVHGCGIRPTVGLPLQWTTGWGSPDWFCKNSPTLAHEVNRSTP
jgi:hypothetical protein